MVEFGDAAFILHEFAQATGDFMFAALALSFVAALAAHALEKFLRPAFQRLSFAYWVKWTPVARALLGVTKDRRSILRRLPKISFTLPPEQFCAVVAKSLEVAAELVRPGPEGEGDGALVAEVEEAVDTLQARLTRQAMWRSYAFSAAVASLAFFALSGVPRAETGGLRPGQAFPMLSIMFGIVGGLLAPVLQGPIARIAKLG